MLLNDTEIKKLLNEMRIETEDAHRPFKAEEQIQPCSIDLRLDNIFWIPRRLRWYDKIDLRQSTISGLETERLYERRRLKLGEGIRLKPGELLLGRTFEKFIIPNGYAGKLEGRSSFARLGLSIHCTGDFINSGWKGRMPLQLVNHGKTTIVITPYIDICQLLVVKTIGLSDRPYGAQGLDSKYIDDEGEPSKYWVGERMKKLRFACNKVNIAERVRSDFEKSLKGKDISILNRFSEFINKLPSSELTHSQEVLEKFVSKESFLRRIKTGQQLLSRAAMLPFIFFCVTNRQPPFGWFHCILWILTIIAIIMGVCHYFFAETGGGLSQLKRPKIPE